MCFIRLKKIVKFGNPKFLSFLHLSNREHWIFKQFSKYAAFFKSNKRNLKIKDYFKNLITSNKLSNQIDRNVVSSEISGT